MFDSLFDADSFDRGVIIGSCKNGTVHPSIMSHFEEQFKIDCIYIFGLPFTDINAITVSILAELEHNPDVVDDQIWILSDCEVCYS